MGIGDMAIHLFSPAKLFYMAYVVLVVLRGVGNTSKTEFFLVSLLFFVLQVGHDDYLRIRLNRRAEANDSMTKFRKDLEAFRSEIHGGGTQEKLMFFVIDAMLKVDGTTKFLNGILIGVGLIQVWLAVLLLRH